MGVAKVTTTKSAVFFDRDGTLNYARVVDGITHPPPSAERLRIYEDAPRALRELHERGFAIVVITNQPDLARGNQTWRTMKAIHRRLEDQLPVDAIFVCPHDDSDSCGCRKPRPGLLLQAASELNISLAQSFMVGDSWRDMAAAKAAGAKGVFINRRYSDGADNPPCDANFSSLSQAVEWILKQ